MDTDTVSLAIDSVSPSPNLFLSEKNSNNELQHGDDKKDLDHDLKEPYCKEDEQSITSTNIIDDCSMQLSLPESFDDALTFNGIPVLSDIDSNNLSSGEAQVLNVQLHFAQQRVKDLLCERKNDVQSLNTVSTFDEVRITQIQKAPPHERSLADSAALIIHDAVKSERQELNMARERLSNALEIAEQQKEKAANTQILCEQRISNAQETIDAARGRHKELEIKIDDQQNSILDLREKGRMYDDLISERNGLKDDLSRTRTLIGQKEQEIKSLNKNGRETISEVQELNRMVESLHMNKTFLEKEKSILLERAERAETTSKKYGEDLREATIKVDKLAMQLAETNLGAKSSYDERLVNEANRIREESGRELSSYRSQVEAAYEREIHLLRETKSEIAKQCNTSNEEIGRLRENVDKLTTQKDSQILELERALSDSRSEFKIKSIETTRLIVVNETLNEEMKAAKREIEMLTDQVDVHQSQFQNLEQQSLFERKRLTDELQRKEDQLEIYYQSSSVHQTFSSASAHDAKSHTHNSKPNNINHLHLLDKSTSLSKKCGSLQKQITSLQGQLKKQVEKSKQYETKLIKTKRALHNVTNKGENSSEKKKIFSSGEEKTDSTQITVKENYNHLLAQSTTLREDLNRVRQERDKLSEEFSFLLEKYHELVGRRDEIGTFPISSPLPSANNSKTNRTSSNSTIAHSHGHGYDRPHSSRSYRRPKKVWTVHAGSFSAKRSDQKRSARDFEKHTVHHASAMHNNTM